MRKKAAAVYPGRIIRYSGGFRVKPFIFKRGISPLQLDCRGHELEENDIISYIPGKKIGRVTCERIVAKAGTALADLYGIAEHHGVTIPYPDAVLAETREILSNPCIEDPGLVDLRDKPFITIDNKGSRDLDQALYIEKNKNNFTVYYALADAGFYIRPGSALFDEALRRGSTFYFPGFSVAMLPPELSEGILSLNPGVDRRAFVFVLDMDKTGEIRDTRCLQARIHSRAQLTYNGVQHYYDEPDSSPLRIQEYTGVLDLLKTVGETRIEMERRHNRVNFDREETFVSCSKNGRFFIFAKQTRNDCSRYNEQLSLMCNIAGGRFLVEGTDPNIQGIYRIHQGPDKEDLDELCSNISDILKSHGIKDRQMRWKRGKEPLADYMDRLYFLHENKALVEAIERQVLLSMKRSLFTSIAGEHFALAANPYSRFSSPMREIVGIFIHKEALEKLGLMPPEPSAHDIELREKVIEAGNRSKSLQNTIEKEVVKCAADRLFRNELSLPAEERTVYHATILGIKATRLYVRFDEPPIELKVYTEDLESYLNRPLRFTDSMLVCRNTGEPLFRTGDEIDLYVDAYKKDRWRLRTAGPRITADRSGALRTGPPPRILDGKK
ncbi:MAG: RNB domain-containing ribonuclease [Spirochaetales bacterium]|nr:RNB domain-containing ribonuclease [Spirochaetales bacterium]